MLCVQILCDVYKVELTVFTGQSLMRTVVEKMKTVIRTRMILTLCLVFFVPYVGWQFLTFSVLDV